MHVPTRQSRLVADGGSRGRVVVFVTATFNPGRFICHVGAGSR